MKFKLEEFKNFKDVISATELLLDEIKLEADSDGIRFRGLDRSHIAFIGMNIESDYFDEYDIDEPDACVVDTGELMRILKRSRSSDELFFSFDSENVTLQFIDDKKGTKRTFNLKQIDMDYESPSMPNIQYPISLNVDSKLFNEFLRDVELYSDKVRLETDNTNLYVVADGDFGDYKSIIELDNQQVSSSHSVFSLAFLKKFFKLNGLSSELFLKMGTDMPLKLSMEDEQGLKVEFLLAPRIEEDY